MTNHLSENFIKEMKQLLLKEKDRLQKELESLPKHTEIGSDPGENAEEAEMDEVNQVLLGKINKDLEKIKVALEKIEKGLYGLDKDGRPISEERLRVLPWADQAI